MERQALDPRQGERRFCDATNHDPLPSFLKPNFRVEQRLSNRPPERVDEREGAKVVHVCKVNLSRIEAAAGERDLEDRVEQLGGKIQDDCHVFDCETVAIREVLAVEVHC